MTILHLVSCRGWSSDAYWAARAVVELERAGHDVTLVCKRSSEARVMRRAQEAGIERHRDPAPSRAASRRSRTRATCASSSRGCRRRTSSTSIAARSTGWPRSPTACRTRAAAARAHPPHRAADPAARAEPLALRLAPPISSSRSPRPSAASRRRRAGRRRIAWWRCRAARTPSAYPPGRAAGARPRRARPAERAAGHPARRPGRRLPGHEGPRDRGRGGGPARRHAAARSTWSSSGRGRSSRRVRGLVQAAGLARPRLLRRLRGRAARVDGGARHRALRRRSSPTACRACSSSTWPSAAPVVASRVGVAPEVLRGRRHRAARAGRRAGPLAARPRAPPATTRARRRAWARPAPRWCASASRAPGSPSV